MSEGEDLKQLRDFRNFLYYVWRHPEGPLSTHSCPDPTPIQYDMADFLQRCVAPVVGMKKKGSGEFKDGLILEAFRGVGKSWITAALVCWLLLWKNDLNIMVVSASKQRADAFCFFCLKLIREIPVLQHLTPPPEARQSMIAFDVAGAPASQAPSVRSVGVMGMMTGGRADVLVADDIEIPNNSETQTMREKLAERSKEFASILKPNGRIVYLGTPQCEDSLYNMLPERGYKKVIWPARYPGDIWMVANGDNLAPKLLKEIEEDPSLTTGGSITGARGKPTDTRFSEEELQRKELEYGSHGFAMQFMLDTSLSDADRYPLKLADLITMDLDPKRGPEHPIWARDPELVHKDIPNVGLEGDRFYRPMRTDGEFIDYQGSVMAIDPSGRGRDEMSYAVVNMLHGYLYLMECRGLSHGYSDKNLQLIAQRAKHWGVQYIVVESNFGDGMFNQLLMPWLTKIYPCTMEEVRHSKQKEARIIDTLEPVMGQHKLVINTQVVRDDHRVDEGISVERRKQYQLFYQMTRITRSRGALAHDDRLDALSIAVNYWVEQMGRDAEEARTTRYEEWLTEELAKHEQSCLGDGDGNQPTWFELP